MEEVLDLAQAFRDEVLGYHLEYYLGIRKTAMDFVSEYDEIIEMAKGNQGKVSKKGKQKEKKEAAKTKEEQKSPMKEGKKKGEDKRGLFCFN